jgi:hypothetical protein
MRTMAAENGWRSAGERVSSAICRCSVAGEGENTISPLPTSTAAVGPDGTCAKNT